MLVSLTLKGRIRNSEPKLDNAELILRLSIVVDLGIAIGGALELRRPVRAQTIGHRFYVTFNINDDWKLDREKGNLI
jgi:hypothetical protein